MAESLINSIARLRVIEKRLLTKEFVGRLCAAPDYSECLKLLAEAGYGANAPEGGDEIEALTKAQLDEAYLITSELMPKRYEAITNVFRMRHDVINIKLLYKLRMIGGDLKSASLEPGGIMGFEALIGAIEKGDYSALPPKIASALEELDVATYKNPDPQLVSSRVDGAYIEYARSIHSPFVKEYFGTLADFTNVLAVARGFDKEHFLPFGEYGEKELSALAEAYASEPDRAASVLKPPLDTSPLKECICAAFESFIKTGSIAAIEKARDDRLNALASERRGDIDSPAPIVGYLLAREREAEVVRLILTVKRSGIPVSALEERSLRLYG